MYNGVWREQMIYKYTVQRRPLWIYGAHIESTTRPMIYPVSIGEKKYNNRAVETIEICSDSQWARILFISSAIRKLLKFNKRSAPIQQAIGLAESGETF